MTTAPALSATNSEVGPGPSHANRLLAEALGTLLLVAAGVFAASFPSTVNNTLGVGFLGVALAVGLAVIVGAYVFGPVSGAHLNPVVTLGLAAAGRFAWRDVAGYIVAQLAGGVVGTSVIALIASSGNGFFATARRNGFAANGFGSHSPGGFGVLGAIVVEFVFMAIFIYVVLHATAKAGVSGFAPLAIGLALTVILLITIPVDGTGLNPARSIAAAVYAGGWAWAQLWVFIVFPVLGGLFAGFSYKPLFRKAATATPWARRL
ncbi:aquaporin [Streptomyces sp. NBC_01445]|uniref:aquaporin n=1 Tax=Streptomyces sp. NBC_01445 TaxID=2903869 RepID=UPI002DDC8660|nr:aquaporin [Streptomyces sp. NBC_01445]WSE11240.1 aquaporin [Streptomyces sp. NBC_01445]